MKVFISPDGSMVQSLYSDKFGWWRTHGAVTIKRATDVRFNHDRQLWEVVILDEDRVLPSGWQRRADAIEAEIRYLESRGPWATTD